MRKDQDVLAVLACYGPKTYGMTITDRSLARHMEDRGLVEWVPPKFGSQLYMITQAGVDYYKDAGR